MDRKGSGADRKFCMYLNNPLKIKMAFISGTRLLGNNIFFASHTCVQWDTVDRHFQFSKTCISQLGQLRVLVAGL